MVFGNDCVIVVCLYFVLLYFVRYCGGEVVDFFINFWWILLYWFGGYVFMFGRLFNRLLLKLSLDLFIVFDILGRLWKVVKLFLDIEVD